MFQVSKLKCFFFFFKAVRSSTSQTVYTTVWFLFCDLIIYYFFFCFFNLMAICIFTCWRFPYQSFYFCYIFALLFLICLGDIIVLIWPLISFLKSALFFLSQSVNAYWRGGKSFPQSSYGPWLGLKIKLKTDWKEKSMQIYLT